MTPTHLLDQLAEEVERLLSDVRLRTRDGHMKAPAVFKGDIPIPSSALNTGMDDYEAELPEEEPVPFIVLRLSDGSYDEWNSCMTVTVNAAICVWDDDEQRSGYRDALTIVNQIFRRFASEQSVGVYTCKLPIEWAMQDQEDVYPYFLCGMTMQFSCPGFSLENEFT